MIEEWITEVHFNRTGELPSENHVTFIWSVAVAIFCVGGMIGASMSGWMADRYVHEKNSYCALTSPESDTYLLRHKNIRNDSTFIVLSKYPF